MALRIFNPAVFKFGVFQTGVQLPYETIATLAPQPETIATLPADPELIFTIPGSPT